MDERNRTRPRTFTDVLLIAVFLAGIGLPYAGFFMKWDTRGLRGENRAITPRPVLALDWKALEEYPGKFEEYFNDRFGFRNSLVAGQHEMKFMMLGVESNDTVKVGREGWLFYSAGKILEDWAGMHPFSPGGLRAWQLLLEQRRDWLASKGIRYLFVIAPEKSSIYPEFLPRAVRRLKIGPSRLDQFVAHMKTFSTLNVLDLRPGMIAAKSQGRLYHKTDTHWNDHGAFVAYQQIAGRLRDLFPDIRVLPLDDFDVRVHDACFSGELVRMLGAENRLREDRIVLVRRAPGPAHPTDELTPLIRSKTWKPNRGPDLWVRDDARGPRAVVVRDSYMTQIIPYLSDHFGRVMYLWHDFDTDVIENEHPDIVIEEFIERRMSHAQANPPAVANFRRRP